MEATHNPDGTVTLTLSRAEAHVQIWGGRKDVHDAVGWNLRHALVASEDGIPEGDYTTMMVEVDALEAELHPDPSTLAETVPTYHELENGEGNGVIHWYCTPECRDAATIPAAYGDVTAIDVPSGEVPGGTRCENCGADMAPDEEASA